MSGLDEITDSLISDMPHISENAIAEHEATQERNFDANNATSGGSVAQGSTITADNPNGWPLDGRGKPYDPTTHEISAATGKAIKKRRGGKSTIGNPEKSASQSAPAQNPQIVEAQKAAANGQFAAMATFATLQGIFGEEFKPNPNSHIGDEFQFLAGAYGNYFLAKGVSDIPPGIALVIAIGTIAGQRLGMPKTKSRIARIKDFFIGKFFSWRAKKTVSAAEKNTKEATLHA